MGNSSIVSASPVYTNLMHCSGISTDLVNCLECMRFYNLFRTNHTLIAMQLGEYFGGGGGYDKRHHQCIRSGPKSLSC
jgi:hypothetical protein